MIKWLSFFVILLGFSTPGEATFHLIVAVDTSSANIALSVKKDGERVQKEMRLVASRLKEPLRVHLFEGSELSSHALLNCFAGLEVNPQDLLFFYFSGHGYHLASNKNSLLPHLHFTKANENLDLNLIWHELSLKFPRQLIVLADCCNNYIPGLPKASIEEKGFDEMVDIHLHKLFLETQGSLLLTAAKPGEVAFCDNEGGFLTRAFFYYVRSECTQEREPSWLSLLDSVTEELKSYQTPVWIME